MNFFFGLNTLGQPECMICFKVLKNIRKSCFRTHYFAFHKEYENFKNEERFLKLYEIKLAFIEKQNNVQLNNNTDQLQNSAQQNSNSCEEDVSLVKAKLKASFIVSFALAKKGRPLEDGSFLKEVTADMLECFGEKGREMSEIIKNVPLSRRTIARRTEDISSFLYLQTKQNIVDSEYFSLCLDESTDINDTSQLLICYRSVNRNFEISEGMLSLIGMRSNVKGKDIYDAVNEKAFSFANKDKLSSICTDGANVMVGTNIGFVGQLRKNDINVPTFHCLLHQQNLFAKSVNMKETMDVVIKVIKNIRSGHKALVHRQFRAFLEELNAEHSDLLLYTEVRWLSKGKCIERFFNLRKEIMEFFKKYPTDANESLAIKLQDSTFLLNLSFFCDVLFHLCQLNLSLQGKKKLIFDLIASVDDFKSRLSNLFTQFKANDLSFFPKTKATCLEFNMWSNLPEFYEFFNDLIAKIEYLI